ncbi:hypothetical protein BKA67DRAFT_696095 [Truncatella angustata]|uniref:SMODS and SLOG-associating 2TM effector domain-containing protein n=1 Tax=Truncatella angustata TaxID=152316 RepID=A0A9P8UCG9_9PEZI|nr:uncharacterized protein BKA67DRAFT_696095 [Truncatella angustata]KAH6646205.1 hypothetical protein BKA67DRAFT_696095 [Truncatella angustata]
MSAFKKEKDVNSPLLSPITKTPNTAQVHFTTATADYADPRASTSTMETLTDQRRSPPRLTTPQTPDLGPRKADTNMSWGTPLGLGVRKETDEALIIFRKALGINWAKSTADGASLEEGRKTAGGIYKSVIDAQTKKRIQYDLLTALLYVLYFSQVVIGAALTALGPNAANYTRQITVLGAVNTIVAGVLALIKGSGQPQRLGKDQIGYRRLQDWIEETEALLAVGVIGKDKREVGLLVEVAFKKYNAAKANEVNNKPDFYVTQSEEPTSSSSRPNRKSTTN